MNARGQSEYWAALRALRARGRFGIRLGLGRTRALLRALGDPQLEVRGALVGGTNGKGSVQALVASALAAAGHRVGQTPKPHLVSYRERILVDGRPIAAHDFAPLVGEVLALADRVSRRLGPPTEFEVLTVASFLWFRRTGVEVGVVEVGLGGRLDATNVWDGGVAAVTNVDLDHTEVLGDTVVAIAREKAAIIKRGDLAVSGAVGDALAVIRRRCRRLGVPLTVAPSLPVVAMDRAGTLVRHPRLGELRVGLLGRHQAQNAAVALSIVDALGRASAVRVPDDALRRGFETARWPGRLELLRGPSGGDVLLDGAHNPAGTAALASALDELRPHLDAGRPTLLMGVVADKDVAGMVGALAGAASLGSARIIATSVPGTTRSLDPQRLAEVWRSARGTSDVAVVGPADEALEQALEAGRRDGGPVVVAGSLYLVGHVRGRLVDDPLLRDPDLE